MVGDQADLLRWMIGTAGYSRSRGEPLDCGILLTFPVELLDSRSCDVGEML